MVDAPLDVFEVSLPFDANVASVNVELDSPPNSPHAAMKNAKGRFTREALTQLAQKSEQTLRATAEGVKVTTIIDSGSSAKHMDIAFVGDGYTAVLQGSQLTYLRQGDQCIGGVQVGATSQGSFQIFGDVLFKQYFAVFDGGNTQVGFAPKAAAAAASSSSSQ